MIDKKVTRVERIMSEQVEYIEKYMPLTYNEIMLLVAIFDINKSLYMWFPVNCCLIGFFKATEDFVDEDDIRSSEAYQDLKRHINILSESEAVHVISFLQILLNKKLLKESY